MNFIPYFVIYLIEKTDMSQNSRNEVNGIDEFGQIRLVREVCFVLSVNIEVIYLIII